MSREDDLQWDVEIPESISEAIDACIRKEVIEALDVAMENSYVSMGEEEDPDIIRIRSHVGDVDFFQARSLRSIVLDSDAYGDGDDCNRLADLLDHLAKELRAMATVLDTEG